MLGDALGFPRSSDDWIQTLLIGAVLIPLSVLILPAFVLNGYLVRVMQAAVEGEERAPSFTNWGELLVDGLKLTVIGFVVSLVINVPVWVYQITVLSGSVDPATGVPASFWAVIAFVLIGGLAIGFFLPAAYANLARNDGAFGAAFDLSTIWAGATTGAYAKAWVLSVLVGIVLGIVGLVTLPLLGAGLLVFFYLQVVTFYLQARGFAEGLGVRDGSRRTSDPTVESL
jgi:hypothetical protein